LHRMNFIIVECFPLLRNGRPTGLWNPTDPTMKRAIEGALIDNTQGR
jgi:hypothetical protein